MAACCRSDGDTIDSDRRTRIRGGGNDVKLFQLHDFLYGGNRYRIGYDLVGEVDRRERCIFGRVGRVDCVVEH